VSRMRRRLFIAIAAALAIVGILAVLVVSRWQMPRIRKQIVALLSERLGARVELADLDVTLGPEVRITGGGLVLHHYRHPDRPPLVRIERFEITAPILAILHHPVHVTRVHLNGMHIVIPPRTEGAATAPAARLSLGGPSPVVIDTLQTSDAVLDIESKKPDRPPRTFLIHDVTLSAAAFDRPVHYDAHLTNPKPTGTIRAAGEFGPWDADEPMLTPVGGAYTFSQADLSTIKGIGGVLDSTGSFGGRLEEIDVKGETRTPDFSIDVGGQPVPLVTTFVALVDGTNGDTLLNDVDGMLGTTPVHAKGGVVHMPGRKGRTVSLEVSIDGGRLEDVLRLALDDTQPPMVGALVLRTRLELPPGEARVPDRLELAGNFRVSTLRFSSHTVQDKIDEFSRRGRGKPTDVTIRDVPSSLRGRFQLKNGVLRLQQLAFSVRGAVVRLDGHYNLRGGALDFRGTVRLEARASQTMTGWKKWVAKVFDPLLAKDGAGTVLPIKVTGTAKAPKFGVERKKIF
jgi:hypothetical protein